MKLLLFLRGVTVAMALIFAISNSGCDGKSILTKSTTPVKNQNGKEIELIVDPEYLEGFGVSGKTSGVPCIGNIAPPVKKTTGAQWKLAQWFCNFNLLKGKIKDLGKNSYSVTTASQTVTVKKNDIVLELRASHEYDGHIRQYGEPWPHLYLEQTFIDLSNLKYRCPNLTALTELRLKINARLVYSECKMDNPDSNLHSSQFNMCFLVKDLKNNDFIWFLVPFYDARYDLQNEYAAQDTGKADTTNKFIYMP